MSSEVEKMDRLHRGLARAMSWRLDLESGEMVEGRGYTKEYCDPVEGGISGGELDWICDAANHAWKLADSSLRLGWYAGELRAGRCTQRELPLNYPD